MSVIKRRVGQHVRRAGLIAIACTAIVSAATFAASAWQGPEWNTTLRWNDGKEVHWRATPARGCDGSNVELKLLNNTQASGQVTLKDITFQCARGPSFVAPERTLGSVAPGGSYVAPVLNCVCAEKGGVKDLMSVGVDFVRNGEGAETYTNGCTYTGAYAAGQPNGRGVYSCPTGYRYEGSYSLGAINGQGKETLPTGEIYEGAFVGGLRNGTGHMTFTDGSSYEGEFVNGKRNGTGTQRFKDGSVYVGEWKDDRRNGDGSYTTGDQQWTYDGAWANDKRAGQGRLSANDGSYTYIGAFANDQRTGQATATFGDGRVFRGVFVNDVQQGQGELTFKDGRKITGQFLDHRPNGPAVEVSNVGTIEGTWTQGVLQGKAVVTYASGERFEGMYANNKRNGPGVDFRLDGSKEECRWIEDVRQSPCTRVTPNGKRIEFKTAPARN